MFRLISTPLYYAPILREEKAETLEMERTSSVDSEPVTYFPSIKYAKLSIRRVRWID